MDRKREDGRPKGTNKIFPFEQTRLGFLLKYEAPLVYDLLWELLPRHKRKTPPIEVIRAVCAASDDPTFKKPKFFRYLEEYERLGVCCKRGKEPTPERMVYYYNLRKRKMERYIEQRQKREQLLEGDPVKR